MHFLNFGSIGQFNNLISSVRQFCTKASKPLPTLEFVGSIKLHGTNGGLAYQLETGDFHAQTRERVIERGTKDDNMGFGTWAYNNEEYLKGFMNLIACYYDVPIVAVYGEWAGPGINHKAAICQLQEKTFFVFNVALMNTDEPTDDNKKQVIRCLTNDEITNMFRMFHQSGVYEPQMFNIYDETRFPVYRITINFDDPKQVQNQLVDYTTAVELQCPVGKYFGIEGVGEGVVWTCFVHHELAFKVKGAKHSSSNVHTMKQIAAVDIERHNDMREFVAAAVSQNRLEQGIVKLGEMGLPVANTSTSEYLKWVTGDVLKEEAEAIAASGFKLNELTPIIVATARDFWLKYPK